MYVNRYLQESLMQKGSARQPWYIGRNRLNRAPLMFAQKYQRNLYIVEKYCQSVRNNSLADNAGLSSFV